MIFSPWFVYDIFSANIVYLSTDLLIIKGLGKVMILVVYAIWQIEYNWSIDVYR